MRRKFVDVLRVDLDAHELDELIKCVKIAHSQGIKNLTCYESSPRYKQREKLILKLSGEFDRIELHNNRANDKGNY